MTMVARQTSRALGWFLLCTVFTATVIQPTVVSAHKKPIVIYFIIEGTSIESVATSGDGFGTIFTFDDYGRTGPGADTPVVSHAVGQAIIARDGSQYLDYTYTLNLTSGHVGSVSAQGITDVNGNGDTAITGGTGAFRSASGYIKTDAIKPNVLLKTTLYID